MNTLFALLLVAQVALNSPGFVDELVAPVAGAPPAGDDCSSANLLFSWHGEDLDVTAGSPAGCSDADAAGTAAGGAVISSTVAQDGTYSVSFPTASADYVEFNAASLFSTTAGTTTFYVYITTFIQNTYIWQARYDANNQLTIMMRGTDDATGREIRASWFPNNATSINVTTTSANMALNTWYLVTVKWRLTGTPNFSIQVDATGEVTDDTELGNFSNAPTTLRFGNQNADGLGYLDNIKIYDSWQ